MKPVMFWRKTSGILRWQASCTKCAPLSADSEKRMPLLATIADGIAPDVREAAHERVAVERLELGEARAVDEPRDHLAHVEGRALVGRDDAGELARGRRPAPRARPARATERPARPRSATASRSSASACSSELASASATPEMRACTSRAAELLGGHLLAGRGLHERRPGEEDRARALHDDALVAHRRHVGAAGGARAHHGRELRDAAPPTCAPGCRRCARSGRGRGRPRPGAAGTRRPSRPGRCTAGGSRARSPARAGAS